HARRLDLRFALPAAGPRGSLCVRGLEGEVCEGLRGGVDQGDEPRPLRPRLISAEGTSRAFGAQPQPIEAARVLLRRPSTEAEALDQKSGRRFKPLPSDPGPALSGIALAAVGKLAVEAGEQPGIAADGGSTISLVARSVQRPEWLADDAVSYEPVSAPNSLLTGKLTGNFADSGPPRRFRRPVSE